MMSSRTGSKDITDILLKGDDIDVDIQENVRLYIQGCSCSKQFEVGISVVHHHGRLGTHSPTHTTLVWAAQAVS